jgi:hypothetical protein
VQQANSAGGFAVKIVQVGFGAENFFDHCHDGVVLCNFPTAAQALTEETAFVDDDAPFTVVLIRG